MNQAKIYVGNLPYTTTENELRDFFAQYGNIEDIKLISDYQTGRSKGFGFITFSSNEEGSSALEANESDFGGRKLNVSTAKDNTERRGGGGSRGGYSDDRR